MQCVMENQNALECTHENVEYLGDNRDARFMRCEQCHAVFVLQAGTVWTIPPAHNDDELPPTRKSA